MKDLFEHYQEQPENLKAIFNNWDEKINNGLDYNQCEQLLKEVENIGFTFEYGLDAEPFNLRKKSNQTIAILTDKEADEIEALKGMIKSCFTYEDYKKDGYSFKKYIEPYKEKLGEKLFFLTYHNEVSNLETNYKVLRNTGQCVDGLTYNSLVKK